MRSCITMSGANENADPAASLGASIHLNEDDWLQLLQKLTPSSIDNLQQTLKRLQQRDTPVVSSEKVNSPLTATTQICASPLVSAATEPNVFTSQNTPLVMSLNVSKAAMPSVITVPSMLNVTKTIPKPMHNTIVLPSSTLLITQGRGQPIPLDSCLPVTGMNRLVVTSGGLMTASTGAATITTSMTNTFDSLNTLATAAVAVASTSSSQQVQSSSECSISTDAVTTTAAATTTTTATTAATNVPVITASEATPSVSLASDCLTKTAVADNILSCPTTSTASVRATVDGLFNSLRGTDISPQLLSSLGTSGLAVYPLQVAANGSTVFLATHPISNNSNSSSIVNDKTSLAHGLNIVGASVAPHTPVSSPASSATSSPNPISLGSLFSASTLTFANSSPLLTSTPVNKPKFKALWETGLQDDNRTSLTLVNAPADTTRPGESSVQRFVLTDSLSAAGSLSLSNSSITRIGPTGPVHSTILGLRPISQAPKRLAPDDQRVLHATDGPKRLLLVSSQAKPVSVDSGLSLSCSNDSLLSKALQPRLPLVTSSRVDGSELSNLLAANHLVTEPKLNISGSQHPLLSPVNILPDVRSFTSTTSSSDHEAIPVGLDSRVEALLNRSLEGGRRMLKEEPVGEDEARRRAKRRERNRVAAARCRQRRQDQIADLQHRVSTLTKTGEELRCSLISLNAERTRLESLIRQHGLEGCTEANELLSSFTTASDALELTDTHVNNGKEQAPPTLQQQNQQRQRFSSATTFLNSDALRTSMAAGKTSTSPGLILITNSLTNQINSETLMNRTNMDKLDLRHSTLLAAPPNLVLPSTHSDMSTVVTAHVDHNDVDCGSGTSGLVTMPIKIDEPTVANDSHTSCSPSTARLATRPVTLIPTARIADLKQVLAASVDHAVSSASTGGTPTPCFWPSDLQTFSPILTPSTWKLLKNLTAVAATSCSTPQSFILTPTFSSLCPALSIGDLVNSSLATSSATCSSTSATSQGVMNLFAAAIAKVTDTSGTTVMQTPPSIDETDTQRLAPTVHSPVSLPFGVNVKPEPVDEVDAAVSQ